MRCVVHLLPISSYSAVLWKVWLDCRDELVIGERHAYGKLQCVWDVVMVVLSRKTFLQISRLRVLVDCTEYVAVVCAYAGILLDIFHVFRACVCVNIQAMLVIIL